MGPRLIFDAADIVGESAVYDERRDALVWVDIGGKRIHRLYLAERRHEVWPAPDFPTSIGLRADGGAVVGLSDRVALWDYGGEFRTLAIVEPDLPDNRLNEGRVGPDGAFWVGTMQNNLEPDGAPKAMTRDSGAIYRIDGNGRVSQLTRREFGIANTMAWTDDGRFLTADTTRNAIYAYDLRAGVLTNKRLFAGPLDRGAPDGSCLDRGRVPLELPRGRRRLRCSLPAGRRAQSARRTALHLADKLRLRRDRLRDPLRDLGALHDDGGPYRSSPRGRRAFRRGCLGTGPSGAPLGLSKDSWFGQRKRRAFGIQRGDGLVDSPVERVRVSEGLMVQMMRLEIAPDGSDVVQFRRILGQPLDGEPVRSGGQRGQGERGGRSLPCLQQ